MNEQRPIQPDSEWTHIQQQVEHALQGIPTYWGRPTTTPPYTTAVNHIQTSQQPPPKGWNQPGDQP